MDAALTIAGIEERRRSSKISQIQLCALANVAPAAYRRALGGGVVPRGSTLRRLNDALKSMDRQTKAPANMSALYRSVLAAISLFMGQDPVAVAMADPKANRKGGAEEWSQAALARHVAIYVIQTEYCVPLSVIGDAVGVTKQAVSKLLRRVEDLRDDDAFDRMVERAVSAISARADAA